MTHFDISCLYHSVWQGFDLQPLYRPLVTSVSVVQLMSYDVRVKNKQTKKKKKKLTWFRIVFTPLHSAGTTGPWSLDLSVVLLNLIKHGIKMHNKQKLCNLSLDSFLGLLLQYELPLTVHTVVISWHFLLKKLHWHDFRLFIVCILRGGMVV